jgi:hypothetical protein
MNATNDVNVTIDKINSEIEHIDSYFSVLNLNKDEIAKIQSITSYMMEQEAIPITKIDDYLVNFSSYLSSDNLESISYSIKVYQSDIKSNSNHVEGKHINRTVAFKQTLYEIMCTNKKEHSELRKKMATSQEIALVALVTEICKYMHLDNSIILGLAVVHFIALKKLGTGMFCKLLGASTTNTSK